jgi:gluconolactonase
MNWLRIAAMGAVLATGGCMSVDRPRYDSVGRIEGATPGLESLVASGARIEKLADGFRWSEGPVWIDDGDFLLLSDVPGNKMYRWAEKEGLSVFLDPSGYDGPETGAFREPGSNGLIKGPGHSILMADHGNRALARLDLATRQKTFLATHFEGKRFNSPNDLVRAEDGSIYFTDPPYGLAGLNQSPLKELPWNGVYRLGPDGKISLLERSMTFPNGIILSPDGRTLYVSNSDPDRAVVMAFPLREDGGLGAGRVFADMTELARSGLPGLPDGMAIDRQGNLFATGPGGVHIFTPEGNRLGRIDTGTAIANCAFGEDGRTLFLASNNYLARIRMRTIGLGY